jgi:hypothetical protein
VVAVVATVQTVNITVSPITIVEGSPLIQTVNITVSPITIVEGNV